MFSFIDVLDTEANMHTAILLFFSIQLTFLQFTTQWKCKGEKC